MLGIHALLQLRIHCRSEKEGIYCLVRVAANEISMPAQPPRASADLILAHSSLFSTLNEGRGDASATCKSY